MILKEHFPETWHICAELEFRRCDGKSGDVPVPMVSTPLASCGHISDLLWRSGCSPGPVALTSPGNLDMQVVASLRSA